MRISFDFDDTLDTEAMQTLCKKFIDLGAEVFVTTSRSTEIFGGQKTNNDDLFQLTDKLGIIRENIKFTSFDDKYKFVKDFDMHFDDEMEQIFLINQHQSKCMGFLYEEKNDNAYKEW